MKPKKNILVLTGSPRKDGNSSLLADAFIQGAESAGHRVSRFDAGRKKIKGCIACQKCYSKGAACVFADDFNELAPMIESSDVLVLVAPLYWFSLPAQIKAAIDKMYSLYVGKRDVKVKESLMFVCAETDDETDFEGVVRSYELTNRYLNWSEKGRLLVPNVNEAGDILRTDALEKAKQMGRDLH